jgi:hypothetical protein
MVFSKVRADPIVAKEPSREPAGIVLASPHSEPSISLPAVMLRSHFLVIVSKPEEDSEGLQGE